MNDASNSDPQAIVVEEDLPHAPDTIWKTLTSGELVARWLRMTPIGFEAVEGKRFSLQTTPAGPWDGVIHCEILEAIPDRRLSYSWKGGHDSNVGYGSKLDTVVTFTLTRIETGTRLRVVHSGFRLPQNETALKNLGGGWKSVVPSIGAITAEQVSPNKPH